MRTGRCVHTYEGHTDAVSSVCFSADGLADWQGPPPLPGEAQEGGRCGYKPGVSDSTCRRRPEFIAKSSHRCKKRHFADYR